MMSTAIHRHDSSRRSSTWRDRDLGALVDRRRAVVRAPQIHAERLALCGCGPRSLGYSRCPSASPQAHSWTHASTPFGAQLALWSVGDLLMAVVMAVITWCGVRRIGISSAEQVRRSCDRDIPSCVRCKARSLRQLAMARAVAANCACALNTRRPVAGALRHVYCARTLRPYRRGSGDDEKALKI